MGTLHEVYQLKPKVLIYGAILKVRKDQEIFFSEKYLFDKYIFNEGQGIFSNTFVTNSSNGKVKRDAMYAAERIIDFEESGIYISIQDGSKHGFGSDFDRLLTEMSVYLEDTLFYVVWDFIICRYEIKDGKLYFKSTKDFANWNYSFTEYILANYPSSKQLIADFYIEEIDEIILSHNERIEYGDNPNNYYDQEDYEDLLNKINSCKDHISIEKSKQLEDWLKIQINYYQ